MIFIYTKTKEEDFFREEKKFISGSWVHVENPSDKEVADLAVMLNLDEGLLRDGIDPYEVPRMETDDGSIYVFARAPIEEEGRITTTSFLVVIGKDFFLTISREKVLHTERFLNKGIDIMTSDRVAMFTLVLTAVYQAYSRFLTNIRKNVRSVSYDIENITNKEIAQFVSFENIVNDFLSALVPIHAIIANFLSGKAISISEEEKEKIEDFYLETGQFIELSKSSLKTIVNIRQASSTIMTNNLNRVMNMLTALTIVLTVPTIISSLYGMNIKLPISEYSYSFWLIIGVTVIISSVIVCILKKNDWF